MDRKKDRHRYKRLRLSQLSGAHKRKQKKNEEKMISSLTTKMDHFFQKQSAHLDNETTNTIQTVSMTPEPSTFESSSGSNFSDGEIGILSIHGTEKHIQISTAKGFEDDIGLWPERSTSHQIDFWSTKEDVSELQHLDLGELCQSQPQFVTGEVTPRTCSEEMFHFSAKNKTRVKRNWLCVIGYAATFVS